MSHSISDCFIERKTNIELFAQAKFQKLKKAHCKNVRAIFLSDLKSLWTSLASSRHSAPSICGESQNFCWIENDRFSKISGKGKNLKVDTNFQKHIPENFSSIQLCESWNFREIFLSLHVQERARVVVRTHCSWWYRWPALKVIFWLFEVSKSFLQKPYNTRKFKIVVERANLQLTFIDYWKTYVLLMFFGKRKPGFGKKKLT